MRILIGLMTVIMCFVLFVGCQGEAPISGKPLATVEALTFNEDKPVNFSSEMYTVHSESIKILDDEKNIPTIKNIWLTSEYLNEHINELKPKLVKLIDNGYNLLIDGKNYPSEKVFDLLGLDKKSLGQTSDEELNELSSNKRISMGRVIYKQKGAYLTRVGTTSVGDKIDIPTYMDLFRPTGI